MVRPPLRKRLGQHHLVGGHLCRPLLEFLRPRGLRVLEIGPGGGVLTRELLAAGASVLAWELDPAWAFLLRASGGEGLRIVVGDALELPWPRLASPLLVAGNLPYNVGTPLIREVLRHPEKVPRAAFLVQLEVGRRLVASPGDPDYGALSVLVADAADASWLGRVRAGSFHPPPKVDGAFVGLELRDDGRPRAEREAFEATVLEAFGNRRKTLRNALRAAWGREVAEEALAEARIDSGRRAETLDLEELRALHRARTRSVASAGGASDRATASMRRD